MPSLTLFTRARARAHVRVHVRAHVRATGGIVLAMSLLGGSAAVAATLPGGTFRPGGTSVASGFGAAFATGPSMTPLSSVAPSTRVGAVNRRLQDRELTKKFADTVLATWPDARTLNPDKGFEYTNGILLQGLVKVYQETRDQRYLAYLKRFFDTYVDAKGAVTFRDAEHSLDVIQPGNVLIFLYQETKEARYKTAAEQVRARLDKAPRNAEGGYWHKAKYADQMWADSTYQGDRFLAAYGKAFGDQRSIDEAVKQVLLFGQHAQLGSGLVRHAWDSSKKAAWADPTTGLSPVVWDRAVGWYAMTLADLLEMVPTSHPDYAKLKTDFVQLAQGIKATQDPASGLWYQVMDTPKAPGNFLETSGSAYFVDAVLRGVELGVLDGSYRAVMLKGWQGVRGHITQTSKGQVQINDAVEGMGVAATAGEYTNHKRLTNSMHGLMGVMVAGVTVNRAH